MLRLAFDFIITWRETRTRPNAYNQAILKFIKQIRGIVLSILRKQTHTEYPYP